MAGRIHMANVSSTVATFHVNSTLILTPGRPMNPTTCQPYFTLVARSRYPTTSGSFAIGDNDLSVGFADSLPQPPLRMTGTLTIPPGISLDDDLILMVFRDSVSLMNARGEILSGAWAPD